MGQRAAHYALGHSPRLALATLLVHAAASVSVLACTALDPALRAALAALVAASLRGCWRIHVARSADRAVRAIAWDRRGWWVLLAGGERARVTPCAASLVHPLVTVVALRDRTGSRHAAIVLEEMLGPDRYRRLRALLTERGREEDDLGE